MNSRKNPNALRFSAEGRLRILQVSDAQDLVHARKAMLRMLDRAYDALKPDLVLFTGDNILGNHLLDFGPVRIGSVGAPAFTLRQMRRALANVLRPVENRGIPFAMIYGNHDDMNELSKEAQYRLFRAYPHCLPMNETDPGLDPDTYAIDLLGRSGSTAWRIYMLDSAWNDETGQYWRVKAETVRWFRRQTAETREANGGTPLPSLLFLHVPLPELKELTRPCEAGKPGAVKTEDGWRELDPAVSTGVMGEAISPAEDPYGLFDAIRESGAVRAVVSGHDHANCFEGTVRGVRMIQSGAASFRCYGSGVRGVRLFTLYEDRPDTFETQYYTYEMLCGASTGARLRYLWDADDMIREKALLIGGAGALAVGAAGAGVLAARRFGKKQ